MNRIAILGLGVFVSLLMLIGCNEEPPVSSQPDCSPPSIQSLTVVPENVSCGATVMAAVDVAGLENVPHEFEWSVSGGQLVGATVGSEVVWITPAETEKASVTCRVSNHYGSNERSVQIDLLPVDISPQSMPTQFSVLEINTENSPYWYENASLTDDGGCYIVGSMDDDISECWIAKLDRDGNAEWERLLRYSFGSRKAVLAMPDGGCVVFGLSDSNGNSLDFNDSEADPRANNAVRLNAVGELVWRKDIGATYCSGADVFADGSIALVRVDGVPEVIKLDSDGNILWRKEAECGYNLDCNTYALWDITVLSDEGMLVKGKQYATSMHWPIPEFPDYGTIIIKLSAEGEVEWTEAFDMINYGNHLMDIADCKNGYLIAARVDTVRMPDGSLRDEATLRGVDYAGNTIWEKPYDEIKYGDAAIRETEDGSFCVASTNGSSFTVCSFDGAGELIWSREHELESVEIVFDVWEHGGVYRALTQIRYHHGFNLIALDYE